MVTAQPAQRAQKWSYKGARAEVYMALQSLVCSNRSLGWCRTLLRVVKETTATTSSVAKQQQCQAVAHYVKRTHDGGAHAEAEDLVADLAGRHLAQHGHRDGLQVERKADDADGGADAVCKPHTLCVAGASVKF